MNYKDNQNPPSLVDSDDILTPKELLEYEKKKKEVLKEKKEKKLFSDTIYNNLPSLLKEGCGIMVDYPSKELFLIGALGVISGILPNVKGFFGGKYYYPNLYVYVLGKYGTGKGMLRYAQMLAEPVHQQKRNDFEKLQVEYEHALQQSKRNKSEPPPEPPVLMLLIPANNSKSGIQKLLSDNEGIGLIVETEGDTLTDALKNDFGGFSDILRKGFEHENITSFRKTNNEYLEICEPKISVVLSSTYDQMRRLIPSIENGLFSRFIYYQLPSNSLYNNPFDTSRAVYPEAFKALSEKFLDVYNILIDLEEPIVIKVSKKQEEQFVKYFNEIKSEIMEYASEDLQGTVNRLGVICFRIMMILTILRALEKEEILKPKINCNEEDFKVALKLSDILKKTALDVFYEMPEGKKLEDEDLDKKEIETSNQIKKAKELRESGLSYLDIAKQLRVSKTTAYNYANK